VNLRVPLTVFIVSFVASGCASTVRAPEQSGESGPRAAQERPSEREQTVGQKVVSIAQGLIGTPYRYGGDTPKKGFDCSGLVYYSFDRLGVKVPRTAADQRSAAERIKRDDLEPGDLVFFRSSKGRVDHVGIYAGDGRFIHAPNAGKVVSYAYLDDPYYRKHFVSAGRFEVSL